MPQQLWVGTRKGLFGLEHGSDGWHIASRSFLGDPVSMVLPDPATKRVYAALSLGHFGAKLQRSDDSGSTWREIAVPVFPEKPAHHPDATPWSLVQIWSLELGGNDRPGVLWCGTIPGGLVRSEDGGDSWMLNKALWEEPRRAAWQGGGYDWPGVHSICVDPRNSDHLTVGVSIGGVWQTNDGGDSWQAKGKGLRADYLPPDLAHDPEQQDPHRIVQSPSDPNIFWMQHHNGIWMSLDDAETWQELVDVSPSSFGFAVVADPTNPLRAWFVPASNDEIRIPVDGAMVVNRTDDGGETFTQLRSGLPQSDAYDLVYRHGMDIAADGKTLALGSTTGSLWLSDNGGDSFATFSANLPSIFCTRFG